MVVVVMGVSGCGKTTVGKLIASRLGIPFYDGDDFHPQCNVDKMECGAPLTDEDRVPWLSRLAREIAQWDASSGAVLACSALKEQYRQRLRGAPGVDVRFVHLKGSRELISSRLQQRAGHSMPPALLDSQFEALEVPRNAIVVSIEESPEQIANAILRKIQAGGR
jgi:carbohydrate kinase (thermoresistant glucokinase family)